MRLRLASCFNYQLTSVLFAGITIIFMAAKYYFLSQDQNSRSEEIVTIVQPRLSKYYAHFFVLQAPVVQTMDSAIHRINRYPLDK